MTIEQQLDELVVLGGTTNDLLSQILAKMGGAVPIPPEPEPPNPEPLPGETLMFVQNDWKASDVATGAPNWKTYDRPPEGTFAANLSWQGNRMNFNKQATQPGGYGSSVVARILPAGVKLAQLRVKHNMLYNSATLPAGSKAWAAYPHGCKNYFWSNQPNTIDGKKTNHVNTCNNGYDNKLRPQVQLQEPFFTYYCDFVIQEGVEFTSDIIMNFKEKWLEMWIDGVQRKINTTAWAAPSVLRVTNVNWGIDHLDFNIFQYDPTEPACPEGVPVMAHSYGKLEVFGIVIP